MDLIKWGSNLELGILSIDTQHQKLVKMINELNDAMSKGAAKNVMGKILNDLVQYTKTHFATEEKYFETHKYPQAAAHKKEHDELTNKVLALLADLNAGKTSLSIETLKFLKQWLSNHIEISDKAYAPFLKSKGVT